jgi:ATP-dependent protease ClpP protease subunit
MASTQTLQGLSKPRLIYRAPEIFESSAQCLDCGVVDKIVEKCNVLFKDLWGSVDESRKRSAEEFIKTLQDAILGVVICLPQNSAETETASSTAQCLDCGVVDKIVEKCNVLFKDLWGSVDESRLGKAPTGPFQA